MDQQKVRRKEFPQVAIEIKEEQVPCKNRRFRFHKPEVPVSPEEPQSEKEGNKAYVEWLLIKSKSHVDCKPQSYHAQHEGK